MGTATTPERTAKSKTAREEAAGRNNEGEWRRAEQRMRRTGTTTACAPPRSENRLRRTGRREDEDEGMRGAG
jgi:uncharacterized protein HemY